MVSAIQFFTISAVLSVSIRNFWYPRFVQDFLLPSNKFCFVSSGHGTTVPERKNLFESQFSFDSNISINSIHVFDFGWIMFFIFPFHAVLIKNYFMSPFLEVVQSKHHDNQKRFVVLDAMLLITRRHARRKLTSIFVLFSAKFYF